MDVRDFAFYLLKHVKIKECEAFQYKPDAQARDPEILGKIRSLALRACICATSKFMRRVVITSMDLRNSPKDRALRQPMQFPN